MDNVFEEDVMVKPVHDIPNYKRQSKSLRTQKGAVQTNNQRMDSVHLSEECRQMEALKALILSDPEIQANKMAFIKEAIAEGRYESNCDKIAEKILADTLFA